MDEKVIGEGIRVLSHDIKQGIVLAEGGVKATAFWTTFGA
jgi:hypothetical protein